MEIDNKRILIVVAHPDDEVLGCAATIAKLNKQGHTVTTLILGEGKTSRDDVRNCDQRRDDIKILREEIDKANEIMGVEKVFIKDFPDNRFDSVDLLDLVKVIEKIKKDIEPDIIFTHYENDCNVDHLMTYKAVMTATRPMANETVKKVYAFEVMSSTEWRFPLSFSPNVFFDIGDTIDIKIKSMRCYQSELCEYPHPRSLEAIKIRAQDWGSKVGVFYAEAFQLIREINR